MPRRQPIPGDLRAAVIARDGLTCQLCGRTVVLGGDPNVPDTLNLDHRVQFAIGGPDTLDNLRVLCAECNWHRPKPVTDDARAAQQREAPRSARRRALRRSRLPLPTVTGGPGNLSARQRRMMSADQ